MTPLSQRDSRWSGNKLGTCTDTFGQSGCVITCLAMLSGKTPVEVNAILLDSTGYASGCLVIWDRAASLLNLPYNDQRGAPAFYPTIAETDHFKVSGVPQHFFILLAGNEIIDPLDGKRKANPYRITSYRNLGEGNNMTELETYKRWHAEVTELANYRLGELETYMRWHAEVTELANQRLAYIQELEARPPKEVVVTVEKIVEREVIKEVKVPAEELSALEHLRLAINKFLGR